ncbi:MAG: ribonuclease HII [Alphaproteobacteria bacterium]|jgi:ribonuclease HII|nr:ribonuclease HII [Alphaproteobacteria bacterium]
MSNFDIETKILADHQIPSLFYNSSFALVAGTDEVGRGCLAGPVVACCLCLKANTPNELLLQITDSKKLSPKKREVLALQIKNYSHYKVAEVDVATIDKINILQASLCCMNNACTQLLSEINPKFLIIDGNKSFNANIPSFAVIDGDNKSLSIAAASIIAKVYRDNLMKQLAEEFPYYFWEKNAGYGTKQHLEAINKYGITPFHRKTFAPIKNMLETL